MSISVGDSLPLGTAFALAPSLRRQTFRVDEALPLALQNENPQLIAVEIYIRSDEHKSVLKLSYQSRSYDLVQAFGSHQRERAEQKLQQLSMVARSGVERYLLVKEVGYYSLWELDISLNSSDRNDRSQCESPPLSQCQHQIDLELQQASIWLFQELWLQWQDLLGTRQLQVFADSLLAANPQLGSWVDLDRLLNLDPLGIDKLESWSELDLIGFDRQLYQLTQKKLGQQFGTKLMIEIIQLMPDSLRLRLLEVIEL